MTYRVGETELGEGQAGLGGWCHYVTFHCENGWAVWLNIAREVLTSLMAIPTQSCVLHLSPVGRSLLDTKFT